ncbi:MAG: radical SAM protein, partial [Planctomycetes bacterium]|nr:radical SAM protein [Planctomycetota bacterium]
MTSSSIPTNRFHDFAAKLLQPAAHESLEIYLDWQRAVRKARVEQQPAPAPPLLGPISINLDLTTACNYACDHCIDWESLNSPVRHQDADLRAALTEMAKRGLRSVILIGGGEPTLHPGFVDMVQFLKEDLGQQVAVVTNGSRNEVIAQAAEYLEEGDWVRLSLDSGTDATFQAMHHPKKNITLNEICTSARLIREANNQVTLGFSFVITWEGAQG